MDIAGLSFDGIAAIGSLVKITKNTPPGELTLSRAPQQTRKGWKRPTKQKK